MQENVGGAPPPRTHVLKLERPTGEHFQRFKALLSKALVKISGDLYKAIHRTGQLSFPAPNPFSGTAPPTDYGRKKPSLADITPSTSYAKDIFVGLPTIQFSQYFPRMRYQRCKEYRMRSKGLSYRVAVGLPYLRSEC